VAEKPQGENGFGYDPIFYVPELGKTFAQLSDGEKNARSHRGRAIQQLAELLKEQI
jgi:XTP/dITP diphosphohydrolase